MPKPVNLSSQAIQGLSAGSIASTARLVKVSLFSATRLPVCFGILRLWLARVYCQHSNQHKKVNYRRFLTSHDG